MRDRPKQEQLWEQVTADFRQACLLRRQGRQAEADGLLNHHLPPTIAEWSTLDTRPSEAKKGDLLKMFAEEQQRVDSALVVQRLVTDRLSEELVPSLCSTVADQVRGVLSEQVAALRDAMAEAALLGAVRATCPRPTRQRVRIDDLPAVIDAVLEEQQTDYGPKPVYCCRT